MFHLLYWPGVGQYLINAGGVLAIIAAACLVIKAIAGPKTTTEV